MLKLDLTLRSTPMIYALLSYVAKQTITANDVSVSLPEFTAPPGTDLDTVTDTAPNTKITLTYKTGSEVIAPGGTDNLSREYTRKRLSTLATVAGFSGTLNDGLSKWNQSSTDESYKIQKLNQVIGTNFDVGEVFFLIDSESTSEVKITAQVTDIHYGIFGSTKLTIFPIA